jgi:hypothetical protein
MMSLDGSHSLVVAFSDDSLVQDSPKLFVQFSDTSLQLEPQATARLNSSQSLIIDFSRDDCDDGYSPELFSPSPTALYDNNTSPGARLLFAKSFTPPLEAPIELSSAKGIQ